MLSNAFLESTNEAVVSMSLILFSVMPETSLKSRTKLGQSLLFNL